MRAIIEFFLLTACVKVSSPKKHLSEVISDALGNIKTSLNKHRLLAIQERFHSIDERVAAKLALSPRQEATLAKSSRFQFALEVLTPIEEDHISEYGDSIEELNEKAEMDELLFQGDIVLTDEQAQVLTEEEYVEQEEVNRSKRQTLNGKYYAKYYWTDGIYFSFHQNATEKVKSVFRKAAKQWHENTCIDFAEKPNAPERIQVMVESGCWSYVGSLHKVQPLSLGRGCDTVGTATHELGHAIGMFHTHSRHDRDNYIMVNVKNIKASMLSQFKKETPKTNNNYGVEYDCGSIMHYTAKGSSSNGKPALVPLDTNYFETLGSPLISFNELRMVNKHYGCLNKCISDRSAAQCKNYGFPHPRDCSKCICPSGYGGKLCNERPSGCGKILQAGADMQVLKIVTGDLNSSTKRSEAREDFMMCHYWIEASTGKRIEITIDSISKGFAVGGCKYGGVEIKTNKDQRMTGYRFCASQDAGKKLMSYSNRVPIITFNRFYATEFVLKYRAGKSELETLHDALNNHWQIP